ncbi:HK97 gp10 family phage protein [Anaerosinus sp.]
MKSKNGLKNFAKQLNKIRGKDKELFYERVTKELAARFLSKVIKRTPVGKGTFEFTKDNKKRKLTNGGTLRRGWTTVAKLRVVKIGNAYQATITNNVKYASYVEYGHRQTPGRYVPAIGKKLKSGWVKGQFMMTISAEEIKSEAPAILQRHFIKFLKGAFHVK